MRSKKSNLFLRNALVSLIVAPMLGFLGFGVRAFTTTDTAQFILSAGLIIFVGILVLYFTLRRPTRELTAHSLFRAPSSVKRSLFPRLSRIAGNPLILNLLPAKPPHQPPCP
jgi:uncharacterized membrane protein YtjA (UPF0391 family)